MNTRMIEKVYSEGVISRLSQYLKCIVQLKETGKRTVTSREISDSTNINSAEVRRDLIYFGIRGKRGVGFNIDDLIRAFNKNPELLKPETRSRIAPMVEGLQTPVGQAEDEAGAFLREFEVRG